MSSETHGRHRTATWHGEDRPSDEDQWLDEGGALMGAQGPVDEDEDDAGDEPDDGSADQVPSSP